MLTYRVSEKNKDIVMKWIIATGTAAALLAGVGAANAQTWRNNDSGAPRGQMMESRGQMMERNVGLRTGQDWNRGSYGFSRSMTPDNSTYNSYAFRSQEVWPQSPPGGGY